MTVRTWTGVEVNMESSKATANPITAMTNADPCVVTYTGSDPSNGDIVYLTNISGIPEANNRPFRVANVDTGANTIELEGFDSTNLGTFVAGTAQFEVVTLGNTFDTFLSFSGQGGEAAEIDVTTVHDTIDQNVPGNKAGVTYQIGSIWDPGDAGFQALEVADDDQTDRVFQIKFSDDSQFLFGGRVSFLGIPTGDAGARVETPASIFVRGRGTNYNS